MNVNEFVKLFKEKCGRPDSRRHLLQYLRFLLSYTKNITNEYCEKHHILPRSIFKEYVNCDFNIVNLTYSDHIYAHELLVRAYTNRRNLRTLNFMKNETIKNSNLISIAAKKGWRTLKADKQKYEKFINDRSKYMRELSRTEQSRRAQLFWKNMTDEEYIARCQKMKNIWTYDLKNKKSIQMREYLKQHPGEISKRLYKRYSTMPTNQKKIFIEKMNIVNKDIDKRKKASASIKALWQNPSFKNKMKNRKTSKRTITATSPAGITYERYGLIEMITEFNFSSYLVRKFNNTGKPVISTNTKNKQVQNTIGWTFAFNTYKKK